MKGEREGGGAGWGCGEEFVWVGGWECALGGWERCPFTAAVVGGLTLPTLATDLGLGQRLSFLFLCHGCVRVCEWGDVMALAGPLQLVPEAVPQVAPLRWAPRCLGRRLPQAVLPHPWTLYLPQVLGCRCTPSLSLSPLHPRFLRPLASNAHVGVLCGCLFFLLLQLQL